MKLFRNYNAIVPDGLSVPEHIGIIMDGNGRWAKKHHLPRSAGHSAGAKNLKIIRCFCRDIGVKYLTVYAFSTENWSRPKEEVDKLMSLMKDYLKNTEKYKDENIKIKFFGDLSGLTQELRDLCIKAENDSKDHTALTLNIALNYGGRQEIIHATKTIASLAAEGKIIPDEINESCFEKYLYTAGVPSPELIIRPSGEKRLSNFLTWQSAYSEFVFLNVMWPDFKPRHVIEAIREYNHRNRRFGGI